ncbi:MAG: DNA mismatch repair endonuclease MutL [Chloroflexi bacterium]|nr:DNA mismatch repair endonuclease MutL [Chloroflexota bacterium]
MPIRVLSETIAAQIAAGEVVERPASVVKELLENSLDAGATSINIEIRGAGSRLIRISDNGHGIPSDEIPLALERHATSKISTLDDIYNLHTLGFRGEALHSIASVSRLTLTSRHQKESVGARILVEGGKVLEVRPVGAPIGTIIEVAELFFNVPARRKFLKSDATERRHVIALVSQYAMAYPQVRFQLTLDGREAFHSTGSGNLTDVLVQALGLETFREMVEVTPLPPTRPDLPPIEVFGFTTTPALHRANRTQITLFVNGRAINDQRLTFAVVQAYHTLLPASRYPVSVLLIQVPPEDVDVNVHPTKAEVRFRHPEAVFTAVQRGVRRAVISQAGTAAIYYSDDYEDSPSYPADGDVQQNRAASLPPPRQYPAQMDFDFDTPAPGRYSQQRPADEVESDYGVDTDSDAYAFYPHYEAPTPPTMRSTVQPDDPTAIPDGASRPKKPRTLPILRVVGQISASYIVAEGPVGMYLIDQHAAHERILFEQFFEQYQARELTTQQVLDGGSVSLNPTEAQLLEEIQPVLATMGFEIEAFGVNTYRVRSVPAILADQDPHQVLHLLLQDSESGKIPGVQTIEDKILRRVCKAAAVKAGQILSHTEMQGLIQQLERCENPHTCPHGRPIMIHLSNRQLDKEFGRT